MTKTVKGMLYRAVVLSYHGVANPDENDDPNRLLTSPEHLASHIVFLKNRGYRFVVARDLPGDERPAEPTAVLTFDDGWRDAITTTLPLLKRLGVSATFYVNPGLWGGQHTDVPGPAGRLLDADETRLLHEEGMEIGSHSLVHHDLRKLDDDELERDLAESKVMIEDAIGAPCRTLAYPFGLYGEREMAAAERAGYECALAWLPGPWVRFAIPRLPAPPRSGARRLALKMVGVRRRVGVG